MATLAAAITMASPSSSSAAMAGHCLFKYNSLPHGTFQGYSAVTIPSRRGKPPLILGREVRKSEALFPDHKSTSEGVGKRRGKEGGGDSGGQASAGEYKKWERRRKEEVNRKIASKKAISVILRREATKALIEKKRGAANSKKLQPRTVLEALHERITALRWESALEVFELLREQMWYKPNSGVYVKLIVMLGKCKQPERAHTLFQAMIDEGCEPNHESYTALLSAYGRSGRLEEAFSLLTLMKQMDGCKPDVHTYSILIKSCLEIFAFDKVQSLLSDMRREGIKPNTVTYNTLVDAYGRARRFREMELTLMEMLGNRECKPDVWTMNAAIRAFGSSGQIETMEQCYEKFQKAGISPDKKTFNILLDSYGKAKMYEKMSAVMEFMQKYYYSWTLVTYNVVIDAFGRAGDLRQMEYLFRLMRTEGIKPDRVTLCSLVKAYGRVQALGKIESVLRIIDNSDVMLDTQFFNCLTDAYGRAGKLAEMRGVLEMMERKGCRPDKATYTTVIKAYSKQGLADQVDDLYSALRKLVSASRQDNSDGE